MEGENFQDAIQYAKMVKLELGPSGYVTFLNLLRSLHVDRYNRDEVLTRINQLFNGKDNLHQGFTRFLPATWDDSDTVEPITPQYSSRALCR